MLYLLGAFVKGLPLTVEDADSTWTLGEFVKHALRELCELRHGNLKPEDQDPALYRVFQAPPGFAILPFPDIPEVVKALGDIQGLDGFTERLPGDRLEQIFPETGPETGLHFILQGVRDYLPCDHPRPFYDALPELRRFMRTSPAVVPLSEATPSEFDKHQKDPLKAFYCGRPASETAAVPATLLNKTLHSFAEDLATCNPSARDIDCFRDLQGMLTGIYANEAARVADFREIMEYHGFNITPTAEEERGGKAFETHASIRVENRRTKLQFYALHVDGRPEVGSQGGDPYCQSILHYAEGLRKVHDKLETAVTNFPCILLDLNGASISVSAAVFCGYFNIEPLGTVDLHCHMTNPDEILSGQRLICALRAAMIRLAHPYRFDAMFETDGRLHPVNFPFPTECAGQAFVYTSAVSTTKRVFRARAPGGEPLVVKFSTRYGAEAHRAAAARGHAPRLRAAERLGARWHMAVMDDISDGWTTLDPLKMRDRRPALERVLDALHAEGFVHGDVRADNVMVPKAGSDPSMVCLIDFDWAGKAGETRYPRSLNKDPTLMRPADIDYDRLIVKEHDRVMARRAFRSPMHYFHGVGYIGPRSS